MDCQPPDAAGPEPFAELGNLLWRLRFSAPRGGVVRKNLDARGPDGDGAVGRTQHALLELEMRAEIPARERIRRHEPILRAVGARPARSYAAAMDPDLLAAAKL